MMLDQTLAGWPHLIILAEAIHQQLSHEWHFLDKKKKKSPTLDICKEDSSQSIVPKKKKSPILDIFAFDLICFFLS